MAIGIMAFRGNTLESSGIGLPAQTTLPSALICTLYHREVVGHGSNLQAESFLSVTFP